MQLRGTLQQSGQENDRITVSASSLSHDPDEHVRDPVVETAAGVVAEETERLPVLSKSSTSANVRDCTKPSDDDTDDMYRFFYLCAPNFFSIVSLYWFSLKTIFLIRINKTRISKHTLRRYNRCCNVAYDRKTCQNKRNIKKKERRVSRTRPICASSCQTASRRPLAATPRRQKRSGML